MQVSPYDPTMGGTIQPPSFQSLYLKMMFGEQHLASGTGFIVDTKAGPALVTARHNLTGRDNNSGHCLDKRYAGTPDRVTIYHNSPNPLSNEIRTERLYADDDSPLWVEHPTLGENCDVALLPLTLRQGVALCPYGRSHNYPDIALEVGDRATVVGFLMGQSAGNMLAIWCTGYVASEPTLDYGGNPKFLIDCRTRQGQSGSPVIAHRSDGMVKLSDGDQVMFTGPVFKPFGVYTGRIHADADVGIVWKWSVVEDLIHAASRRLFTVGAKIF